MKKELDATRFIGWGLLVLIAIMPFHAFLSVYLGSLTKHETVIQAWKELLIVIMSLLALTTIITTKAWAKLTRPIIIAILAFSALALLVSLRPSESLPTFVYGAKTDLEFLALFIISGFAYLPNLEQRLQKTILISSALVIIFGILQVLVLPKDWLAHFGYNAQTLLPYQSVDPAVHSIRIIGTLAGPNQLGEWLILPIALSLYLLAKERKIWPGLLLLGALFVEFNTYSRTAWIGTLVAAVATILLILPKKLAWAFAAASLIIAIGVGIWGRDAVLRQSKLQYYLLHGRLFESQVQGSSASHFAAITHGLAEMRAHPLGLGLGTAGPASEQSASVIITENYYLQVGIEIGILGLSLFLIILGLLAKDLWSLREGSTLAIPLLGALLGLSAVNLFLHGWTDSSTALIFWGVTGFVVNSNRSARHA